MAFWQDFVGGFYQALSPVQSADTAVNIYTETRQVPGGAKQVTVYGTPGLALQTTVGTGRSRGAFTQDGRSFRVMGSTLYERIDATTYASRGSITDDGSPVSFASNGDGGSQLGIVAAGILYALNLSTNALTTPVLPFSNAVMITFLDGYGLINEAGTPKVWFSNLEDFSVWDALDFFTRSETSDDVIAIAVTRSRIWAIGSATTTLYYDSGDTDTPFVPYPGTTIQIGIVNPACLSIYADQLFWIAQSAKGQRYVVKATDGQPQPISTPPINLFLDACTELDSASMLSYSQAGHVFICLTCPGSPDAIQTYSFDANEQLWHARAGWDATAGAYLRWRASGVTAVNGQLLVGDYADGRIYVLDLHTYADDGAVIKRERTAPYVANDAAQMLFLDQVELSCQPGVGLNDGTTTNTDPQVQLEISRDGARTFASAGIAPLGKIGEYLNRAIWRRLGRSRSDRLVLRVTQTSLTPCVWGGLWLRITEGTGQF